MHSDWEVSNGLNVEAAWQPSPVEICMRLMQIAMDAQKMGNCEECCLLWIVDNLRDRV
jgi:hypothetical protein